MLNLTQVPEVFSNVLNIPVVASGLLITLIFILVIVVGLSLLNTPPLGIAGAVIVAITFFTFLQWFPVWITIVIALAIAVLFGVKVKDNLASGGEM